MNRKQFIMLMSIPAVVILVFLGVNLYTLGAGEEILLKTVPVDPRDLFRGDYVVLNYEISNIELTGTPYDYDFSPGETIYATLSKKEKFWKIDTVSHTKPGLISDQVCMKGRVTGSFDKQVSVEWGIESYFVPEGEGIPIERQRNEKNVSVIVTVDSTCSSVLKDLLINDEILIFE